MILLKVLGWFHLIHSPLLILFPFVIESFTTDVLYIVYFFTIMLLYTFVNGECPLSYVCKTILDGKYVAGSKIAYYPEMECVLPNQKTIDYYFGTMTGGYIAVLVFVMFRTGTLSYFVVFVFGVLSYYVFLVRHRQNHFWIVQEVTKYLLCLTLLFQIKRIM